jgi:hypothetical protein
VESAVAGSTGQIVQTAIALATTVLKMGFWSMI